MSILGSLFSKNKQTESQESQPYDEKDVISKEVIDTPFGKGVVVTQRYPENIPYDMSDQPEIVQLARTAMWRYNTKQSTSSMVNALVQMYNFGRERGGEVLLAVDPSYCQVVGMGYTLFALLIQDGDGSRLVNFAAAENALYCLGKGFNNGQDKRTACLIFSLLNGPEDLLMDQFVTYEGEKAQKDLGMPIGMIFMGRNPYRDPSLSEFREQAVQSRFIIMRYFLDFFYDTDTGSIKGAEDFFYLLPSKSVLNRFLQQYDSLYNQDGAKTFDYKSEGKLIFDTLCNQVENTLRKY